MRSLYKIAAVTQQILLNDLTHSLVAQPFCHPNDWMKIFGILKFKIFRFNLFIPF